MLICRGFFDEFILFTNIFRLSINQRYHFGKNQKLKSRKMIQQLFAEGHHYTAFPIKAIWIAKNEQAPLQTGVSVSSRHFKKAVDRNRIKRQIREAYRLQKNSLEKQLVGRDKSLSLFLVFIGKEMPNYKVIYDACSKVIYKLINCIDEMD